MFTSIVSVLFMAGCNVEDSSTKTTPTTVSTTTKTTTTSSTTASIEEPKTVQVSVSTDKNTYHSNEPIRISVDITCNDSIEGAALRIYGLKRGNFYFLNTKKSININAGGNEFLFQEKTPRCNSCSGLRAGTYSITAEVTYRGEDIGDGTAKIELRQ